MFSHIINMVFSAVGIFYGVIVPLIILHIFALFLIPSLLRKEGDVKEIGKAVYCYLAQFLGLIFLTFGGLPTVASVLSGRHFSDAQYLALLFIFAIGGLIYLWHDHLAGSVQKSARKVPATLFFFTVKFIGFLAVTFSVLVLFLTIILQKDALPSGWWVMNTVIFIYGVFIWWFTSFDDDGQDLFSRSFTVPATVPTVAKKISGFSPFRAGTSGRNMNRKKKKKTREKKKTSL